MKAVYESKACSACGERFSRGITEGHKTFAKRRTCSPKCAFDLRRTPTPEPKPCAICGTLMFYSTDIGPQHFAKRKVCSIQCRNEFCKTSNNQSKPCAVCDELIHKRHRDSKKQWHERQTCSRRCKAILERERSYEGLPFQKVCPRCRLTFYPKPEQKANDWNRQKYCCFDCSKGVGPPKTPIEDRFWLKVNQRSPSECWEWTGVKDGGGYGTFSPTWGTSPQRAHRFSWELVNGPIPDGLVMRHLCNNPSCVNPFHLKPGTQRENIIDKSYAGTQYKQKLSVDDVLTIREMHGEGYTYRELADASGVSAHHVGEICKGRAWVHLL